jgi:primosomal protein N' (replication factor Y)
VAGLTMLGPAPMPLSRLKDQYRWHLTLIAPSAGVLTRTVGEAVARARQGGRVRVQADVDPVSML